MCAMTHSCHVCDSTHSLRPHTGDGNRARTCARALSLPSLNPTLTPSLIHTDQMTKRDYTLATGNRALFLSFFLSFSLSLPLSLTHTHQVTKRDYTLAMAIERATKLGENIEHLSSKKMDYVQGRPGMLKSDAQVSFARLFPQKSHIILTQKIDYLLGRPGMLKSDAQVSL